MELELADLDRSDVELTIHDLQADPADMRRDSWLQDDNELDDLFEIGDRLEESLGQQGLDTTTVWVFDESTSQKDTSFELDVVNESIGPWSNHPHAKVPKLRKSSSMGKKIYASRSRMKRAALGFLSDIPIERDNAITIGRPFEPARPPLSFEPNGDNPIEAQNSFSTSVGIRLRGNSNYEYVSQREYQQMELETPPVKQSMANPAMKVRNAARRTVSTIIAAKHGKLSTKQKDLYAIKNSEAWEQYLIGKGIHDRGRVMMSWDKGYPSLVFSTIKYDATVDTKRKKRLKISSVKLDLPRRKGEVPTLFPQGLRKGVSYARYLNPEWAIARGYVDITDPQYVVEDDSWDTKYRANAVDDSSIRQGKHRIVKSLNGYYFSILPYTKKKDLKAELNEVFRERHPELSSSMTLSKIRNLKREVLDIANRLNIELSTVALSYVYFERLVLKKVVDKPNRKLVMSVCLVLALKFNENTLSNKTILKELLEEIERVQELSPKQVLKAEFAVFSHLVFKLKVEKKLWLPHLKRILKIVESPRLPKPPASSRS